MTLVTRKGKSAGVQPPVAITVRGRTLAASSNVVITDSLDALAGVEVCLVTVKSLATEAMGAALQNVLPRDAVVVSFQNGLHNAEVLRAHLGDRVTQGIVSYNVYVDAQGRRQQATSGKLVAGTLPGACGARLRALQSAFRLSGETLELTSDIDGIVSGKLLVNLGNGVSAALGLGTAALLADRDARFCFGACLREGVLWMRRAGLRPARVTVLPPSLLPAVLALPDAIVSLFARVMVGVHPEARSSTLQDLDRGRATEIDDLNGAIVTLAQRSGGRAPHNQLVTEIVHDLESAAAKGQPLSFVSPRDLRARMERAGTG